MAWMLRSPGETGCEPATAGACQWLRRVAMHKQVRQQRLGARRVQGRHPLLAERPPGKRTRIVGPRASGRPGAPAKSVHCVRMLRSARAHRSALTPALRLLIRTAALQTNGPVYDHRLEPSIAHLRKTAEHWVAAIPSALPAPPHTGRVTAHRRSGGFA
jgi:hypothetical protein